MADQSVVQQGDAKCFACERPLKGWAIEAQVCGELTIVHVGPDCFKRIVSAGDSGYQPPLGGPKLRPPTDEALAWDAEQARALLSQVQQ